MKNGLRGLFTLKANGDSGAALGAAAALIQGLVLLFFPGRLEASGAEGAQHLLFLWPPWGCS